MFRIQCHSLQAPALSHETQQRFWGRAQAGDEAVRSLERLAITGACRDHFRDPAGAMPVGLDVLRRFFARDSTVMSRPWQIS